MEVRAADPADAAAIVDVNARSAREAYEPIVDDESIVEVVEDPGAPDRLREWLAEVRGDDGACVLIAVDGDAELETVDGVEAGTEGDADPAGSDGTPDEHGVLGFSQCLVAREYCPDELEDEEAYLRSLYVDPDRQGEGVGTALLEATVGRIDARAVVLDVLRDHVDAREFYESRGFEFVGDTTAEIGGVEYETARYRREP